MYYNMFTSLSGYRTYILAGAALAVVAGSMFGLVSVEVSNTLLSILGFSGLISLRAAVR